jgi:hypothetical protein
MIMTPSKIRRLVIIMTIIGAAMITAGVIRSFRSVSVSEKPIHVHVPLERTNSSGTLMGYKNEQFKNVKCTLNRQTGDLTISYDFEECKQITTSKYLIRYFDANGTYIGDFTTKETYVQPSQYGPSDHSLDRFPHIGIHPTGNGIIYKISTKDAAFTEQVEFGFAPF